MLQKQFAQTDRFREPTDEEISSMVGGFPVFSYHPEDLPHFQIIRAYTKEEAKDRTATLKELFHKRYPELILDQDTLTEMILNSSAHMFVNINEDERYDINFFILQRPSRLISAKDELKLGTGLGEHDVNLSQSIKQAFSHDKRWIDIQHEIAHMKQYLAGRNLSLFQMEIRADEYALSNYVQSGGNLKFVKSCILERALSSFLWQPEKYWFAPQLQQRFIDQYMYNPPNLNEESVQQSIYELRGYISSFPDFGKVFEELANVLLEKDLSIETRYVAEQILDAVREFCPSLYPAEILESYQKTSSAHSWAYSLQECANN